MAHQFNDTSTALASDMQSTSSRKKYARRLLLGYGESGMVFFYRINILLIESSENKKHRDAINNVSHENAQIVEKCFHQKIEWKFNENK